MVVNIVNSVVLWLCERKSHRLISTSHEGYPSGSKDGSEKRFSCFYIRFSMSNKLIPNHKEPVFGIGLGNQLKLTFI